MANPRQYSLCKFDAHGAWEYYPFSESGTYIFLGEIPNMPGHCVTANYKTGQIYSGWHTNQFVEIPEDEV
jgi:hypothetical protein